jgi:S1-C subfamily serine protease
MIRFIGAAVCVVAALFGAAALAQTVIAASPIRSFDWTYKGAEDPGDRHWSSPDGVAWTETYPSGRTQTQKVWASAQVGGCSGVITKKLDSSNSQTFIPNPGCSPMLLLFRADDGPWRPIGVIRSVSSQSGAIGPPSGPAQVATGSGIFVNTEGLVLTNNHVAGACKAILIKAYNALPTQGLLEAVDPKNDLALVRTHAGYGAPVVFRPQSKPARLGESVGVVGYPLVGLLSSEPKATFGQINSVAGMNNDYTLLQISAPVQPGNSGGPVFGEDGSVLGIVVSTASPALIAKIGTVPQNINFAIRGEIAQIFMTAHGVSFRTAGARRTGPEVKLDTADIAQAGERSTAQILCIKP